MLPLPSSRSRSDSKKPSNWSPFVRKHAGELADLEQLNPSAAELQGQQIAKRLELEILHRPAPARAWPEEDGKPAHPGRGFESGNVLLK